MKVYILLAIVIHTVTCRVTYNSIDEYLKHVESAKAGGKHWALIIAGSAGWDNYRHQADACHAYHVVLKHGIPKENVIIMMYDDIAQNEHNPTPGIVINHPHGNDVYGNISIDYRREDVTPKNFLAIMRGDKGAMSEIGTGRVIDSGPNDHVFVNFVDHGAPGILGFPDQMLHVKPFMKTIKQMNEQKKFKQLVFYIEACESGSMFNKLLPDDINVWATTAASPNESSYACYFDDERDTYLGDVYSVKWMEDSDVEDLSKETLHKQFKIVKQETNTSHVQQYGEKSIAKESVSEFQGGKDYVAPKPVHYPKVPLNAVPSEDVPMAILRHRLSGATTLTEKRDVQQKIKQLQQGYDVIDQTMHKIVTHSLRNSNLLPAFVLSDRRHELTQHQCYETAVERIHSNCFKLSNNGYALKRLYYILNLCEERVKPEDIVMAIDRACP